MKTVKAYVASSERERLEAELRANVKPRAGEHTKGPWRSGNGEDYNTRQVFIRASEYDDHICVVDTEVNARRIVACVNACEGFSTAELENRSLMDQLRAREKELAGIVMRVDELSEAFDLQTDKGRTALANEIHTLGFEARAALSKVRGA